LINGDNLLNSNRFDEALKVLIDGEKFIEQEGDHTKLAHLLSLKANCYGRLFFLKESNQCLLKAEIHANEIEDMNDRLFEMGRIYRIRARNIEQDSSIRSKLDSVLYYRKKSYAIQDLIIGPPKAESGLIIEGNAIGDIFIKKGNLDSAALYFRKSLVLAEICKIEKFSSESLLGIGLVHYIRNHPDSALIYYHNALKIAIRTKNNANIKESYYRLSLAYDKLGNTISSLTYSKRHSVLADSMAQTDKKAVKVSAEILMKEQSSIYTKSRWNYTIIILLAAVCLLALVLVLLKLRKNHQTTLARYFKREHLLNRKLAFLQSKVLTDTVNEEALKDLIALAMVNDARFLIKFKELHPLFTQKLVERAPGLTTSDLIVCAHMRLGFYTKEIARYTKSTVRSIEQRKYRIRKKLDIPNTENINIWMMNL